MFEILKKIKRHSVKLIQRKTQNLTYWQKNFSVTQKDFEFISNQIIEENRLFTLDDIAIALVKQYCDLEEVQSRSELQQGKLYQPKESYEVDEKLVFPMLDFAVGAVTYTREAQHPDYGTFTVIGVDFENKRGPTREFAANFSHPHLLNDSDQSFSSLQGAMTPEEIYEAYRDTIRPKVEDAFDANDEFVRFQGKYFLTGLLVDFHEGLFNIADAAIDINQGPLGIDPLIEQMGLTEGKEITDLLRFGVSYRLANDDRFEDVGPSGQSLWYLERLEPPEARHKPRRLQFTPEPYDASDFDDDLYDLLVQIDDEATEPEDITPVDPELNEITITLNYPHRRVGTLPLTPKTETFFPTSDYNPVRFEFVDGRSGDTFPGWAVSHHRYVFGLEAWFNENNLPVGAYIHIKRGKTPLQVIIEYEPTRTQRDWVRLATVTNNRLTFQMNKEPLACRYDELMIIGETDPGQIDSLWLKTEDRQESVYRLLRHIFPELSKLNPQSTVHAKTLYSAVNIIRRVAPGVVFQELTTRACFIPMDHGYWTYDASIDD